MNCHACMLPTRHVHDRHLPQKTQQAHASKQSWTTRPTPRFQTSRMTVGCLHASYQFIRSTTSCNLRQLLAPAYFFAAMCMSVARTTVAAHAGRSPMRLAYAATAGQSARSTCARAMLGRSGALRDTCGAPCTQLQGARTYTKWLHLRSAAVWTRAHCESTRSPGVQAPRAAAARAAGGRQAAAPGA